MSNILLTSGRGAFALALARCLHSAGHRVFMADSWQRIMTRHSSAVVQDFLVPRPAQETADWLAAIAKIVDDCEIDLIVPVYEEIFHLLHGASELPSTARIFASDFDTLMTVHSKWLFNQKALQLGLRVPDTRLITSREELLAIFSSENGKDLVYKPAYSRFAAFTVVRPQSEADLENADPTQDKPWVAQEFLPGRPIATFGVAQQGRILAHTAYAAEFSIGTGPTVAYRPLEHPAAFDWVSEFVERLDFTGQIGVDFMEETGGEVSAIECNPRLTGGMFLLKDNLQLAAAYSDPSFEQLVTPTGRTYVFRLAAFFTALRHTEHFPGFRDWLRVMLFGRSTVEFRWNDPAPALLEPWLNIEFIRRCIKEGKRGEELSTLDTEWSREPARKSVAPALAQTAD